MVLVVSISGCTEVDPSSNEATSTLKFSHSTVRLPLPGVDKAVGYFTVVNQTDHMIELVSVSVASPIKVEMHETREIDNMLRMRRLSQVIIEPAATVRFMPGGKHLMLFGLAGSDLVLGGSIALTFLDAQAMTYTQAFTVTSAL